MKEYINEALEKYINKGTYPWHMPGHKRLPLEKLENFWNGVYAHDFTEAKDLDDSARLCGYEMALRRESVNVGQND